VLNATATLWVLVFVFLFGHDHLGRRAAAGVVLGFGGVAMVVSLPHWLCSNSWTITAWA